jgi:putative beta barrel porin BBP7
VFSRDSSIVPELGIRLGYDITPHIRTSIGYTLLWWNGIGSATQAVNLNVNPNLLPPVIPPVVGPVSPAVLFGKSTLVGQGFDFGLELRF